MSEKKFEECSLANATHVEVNGKMHELDAWEGSFACKDYEEGHCVGIAVDDNKGEIISIPISLFQILGIQPLKEIKPEPIEFEFIPSIEMVKGSWLGENIPMEAVGKKFKCVEILEGEE